jgi:ATP-binding protein involved in chromosome partitioning
VVVVTTPQEVALADAQKAVAMLSMVPAKIPVLGVVENMSWFTPLELPNNKYLIFGEGGGEKLASYCNSQMLAQVPLFMNIMNGGDEGVPAALQSDTQYGIIYRQLAQAVAQQVAILNGTDAQTS